MYWVEKFAKGIGCSFPPAESVVEPAADAPQVTATTSGAVPAHASGAGAAMWGVGRCGSGRLRPCWRR